MRIINRSGQLFTTLFNIFTLMWRAHHVALSGVILLNVLQGLLPLATAWVTKLLFDLLARRLAGDIVSFWQPLLWLVAAQAVLMLAGQLITPLAGYLRAELYRRLSLNIQTNIYQKIDSFTGLAPFENPQLHDAMRRANQGARHGCEQTLWLLTSLIQSSVTLVSFVTVLLAFSPLLAGLVAAAALPQLAVQLKLGRQRVQLMHDLTPNERRKFYYDFLLSHEKAAAEMRLLHLGHYFIDKVSRLYRRIHRAERKQQQREVRWEATLGTLSSLVASGAFLAVVVAAFNGRLTLGDVTLYLSAVRAVQELILDEPTAALDSETESRLVQLLTRLKTGRTSLLISHRFSTVRMADCIAVLDDGRIATHGAHAELLARGGQYAHLYHMQAEKYQD